MKLILAAALCTMLPSALNADGFPPRLVARLDEKLAEKVWIAKEHKSAYQIQKSFKQEIYADGVGSLTVEVEIFLKTDGTPKVAKIFVLDASKGQPAMVTLYPSRPGNTHCAASPHQGNAAVSRAHHGAMEERSR